MDTFLACSTIGGERCIGGLLKVVYASGAVRRNDGVLEDGTGLLVEEALAARAMRRDEDAGDGVSFFQCGTPPADDRDGMGRNDMKGLVGEIVAEAVLVECGFGEPFYSKWRHAGTSASRGIDIVMRKGDMLLVSESKHLHAPRLGKGGAAPGISAAIAAAFRQNGDRHTRDWLLWLRRRCVEAARLGGTVHAAAPSDVGALLRMAEIIKNALSDRNVSTCAIVVLDSRHETPTVSIRRRLGRGTLQGVTNPAVAVVSYIRGLDNATIRLLGRYC